MDESRGSSDGLEFGKRWRHPSKGRKGKGTVLFPSPSSEREVIVKYR
jgi:hypothetical protein